MELQLLTLNCWGLWLVAKHRTQRLRLIASELQRQSVDVVHLQEVWCRSDADMILAEAARGHLKHGHHFVAGHFGSGLITLSRFPLKQVGFVQFTAAGDPLSLKGDYFAGKGIGWAQLDTPAGLVDTFNTHLSANYKQSWEERPELGCRIALDENAGVRILQMQQLATFVQGASRKEAVAVIVAGDLNNPPDSLHMRFMQSLLPDFQDAWVAANSRDPGPTANSPDNSFSTVGAGKDPTRIDYIWSSGQCQVLAADVTMKAALPGLSFSDHFGVSARLRLGSTCALPQVASRSKAAAGLQEAALVCVQGGIETMRSGSQQMATFAAILLCTCLALWAVLLAFPYWLYPPAVHTVLVALALPLCLLLPVAFFFGHGARSAEAQALHALAAEAHVRIHALQPPPGKEPRLTVPPSPARIGPGPGQAAPGTMQSPDAGDRHVAAEVGMPPASIRLLSDSASAQLLETDGPGQQSDLLGPAQGSDELPAQHCSGTRCRDSIGGNPPSSNLQTPAPVGGPGLEFCAPVEPPEPPSQAGGGPTHKPRLPIPEGMSANHPRQDQAVEAPAPGRPGPDHTHDRNLPRQPEPGRSRTDPALEVASVSPAPAEPSAEHAVRQPFRHPVGPIVDPGSNHREPPSEVGSDAPARPSSPFDRLRLELLVSEASTVPEPFPAVDTFRSNGDAPAPMQLNSDLDEMQRECADSFTFPSLAEGPPAGCRQAVSMEPTRAAAGAFGSSQLEIDQHFLQHHCSPALQSQGPAPPSLPLNGLPPAFPPAAGRAPTSHHMDDPSKSLPAVRIAADSIASHKTAGQEVQNLSGKRPSQVQSSENGDMAGASPTGSGASPAESPSWRIGEVRAGRLGDDDGCTSDVASSPSAHRAPASSLLTYTGQHEAPLQEPHMTGVPISGVIRAGRLDE